MTDKDRKIQDLRQENIGLKEEITLIVESMRACRFCKNLKNACVPGGKVCKPEWRGLQK
jgi:hypothetical protein